MFRRAAVTCVRVTAHGTGILATCLCALLAANCDRSPTAPDGSGAQVRGIVMDRVGRPLGGALIAALDGPQAGTTHLTDETGKFELTGGPAGSVTVRVSRDGFTARTQVISWEPTNSSQRSYIPVWLDSLESPKGLEPGEYTLTLTIDLAAARGFNSKAPCAGFPEEFASRSYAVTITPTPYSAAYNWLVRSDYHALLGHDLFVFAVAGQFVGLGFEEPFTEELPGLRHVRIGGSDRGTVAAATTIGSTVSVSYEGSFEYCQTKSYGSRNCWHEPADQVVAYHACWSDRATMTFKKR
ncbi:carboxypeptidase-like regulatory domain-containing protein [Luteitalea pratensis]|nr:carboxypeptidase-like regulatory domain-containing protein [Luteitalea pratensis]